VWLLRDAILHDISVLVKVLWPLSIAAACFVTYVIVKMRCSKYRAQELSEELRAERTRHAIAERAHEKKLNVYRKAAFAHLVLELKEREEESVSTVRRFNIHR
jgi:hypothetical protein